MKKCLISILCFASLAFSQNNSRADVSPRINQKAPAVYLEYICQDKKQIYLRMHNNMIWHIGVGAEKSYFLTTKPIILGNGNKGFAIPDNEEVPIHYYIEKDELENTKISIPQKEVYYMQNGGGKVASGDSIRFSVPKAYLEKGLKIYVRFSYEWEIVTSFYLDKEPEHRVYFRGGDIGSANTGIEPTVCKESTKW